MYRYGYRKTHMHTFGPHEHGFSSLASMIESRKHMYRLYPVCSSGSGYMYAIVVP